MYGLNRMRSYGEDWGVEQGIPLTPREREVLYLVAEGRRNRAIAQCLGISLCTVKAHLANIFSKLGVNRRQAAVSVASRLGLLASPLEVRAS